MGRHSAAAGAPAAEPLFLAPDFTLPSTPNVRWLFKLSDDETLEWFWDEWGTPPLEQLRPCRNPRSSENNRHIPVTAYSMTMGDHVCLESGLEHDLLRRVDRDPGVRLIVAQPLRLSWPGNKAGSRSRRYHTPDLLTARANGEVTVWDARSEDRIDEDFRATVELTRRACHDVGWRYELFTGLGNAERLNLIWLHGFRKRPPWADQFEDQLRAATTTAENNLGGLFSLDDGTGRFDLKDLQTRGLNDGFRFQIDDLVRIAAAHTIAEIPNGLNTFRHTQQVQALIRRFLQSLGADGDVLLKLDPVRLAKFIADQIERRMAKVKSTLVAEEGSAAVTFPSYECLVTEGFETPLNKVDVVWSPTYVRVPIGGWIKCVHKSARFDTRGEFLTAGILDQSKAVDWWARNDPPRVKVPTPIGGFEPDFFYATVDGDYGVLEIKGDVLWSPEGSDARIKSDAAKNWVDSINAVSNAAKWKYALVIDDDIPGKVALEELLKVAADRSD